MLGWRTAVVRRGVAAPLAAAAVHLLLLPLGRRAPCRRRRRRRRYRCRCWLAARTGWMEAEADAVGPGPATLFPSTCYCVCRAVYGLQWTSDRLQYCTLRDCAWLHLASHVRLREAGLARLSHVRVVHAVPPRMMLGGEMALGFSPGSTESEYIFTHCRTALCHATAPPTWRSGTRAERAIAAARCERARKSKEERERESVCV